MGASRNFVLVMGNLGQDPEVRYTTSGKAIANLSIATTETWTDKAGAKQEHTEWHRVVLFDRTAEVAGEFLKKGRGVLIEGKLRTEKYTDKEGIERWATKIYGDKLVMLPGGERDSEPTQSRRPTPSRGARGGKAPSYEDIK